MEVHNNLGYIFGYIYHNFEWVEFDYCETYISVYNATCMQVFLTEIFGLIVRTYGVENEGLTGWGESGKGP